MRTQCTQTYKYRYVRQNIIAIFLEALHEPWGRKSGTAIAVADAATLLHPMTRLGEMFGSDQVPVDVG